jgi:hypothetical protein
MRRFLPRPTSSKAYLHHIPMTGPAHAVPEPPSTARIRAIIVARMARTSVSQTSRSDCRQTGSNGTPKLGLSGIFGQDTVWTEQKSSKIVL